MGIAISCLVEKYVSITLFLARWQRHFWESRSSNVCRLCHQGWRERKSITNNISHLDKVQRYVKRSPLSRAKYLQIFRRILRPQFLAPKSLCCTWTTSEQCRRHGSDSFEPIIRRFRFKEQSMKIPLPKWPNYSFLPMIN